MQVSVRSGPLSDIVADWLVIGLCEGCAFSSDVGALDQALGGQIRRLVDAKDITGKANELVPLLGVSGIGAARLLVVGLGQAEKVEPLSLLRAATAAARHLSGKPTQRVAYTLLGEGRTSVSPERTAELVAQAAAVGSQGQDLYRAERKRHPVGEFILAAGTAKAADLPAAVARGDVLGRAVNLARQLVNEPPSRIYPASFAQTAQQVAETNLLAFAVFDEHRLKSERMEALLAVSAGSDQPPRMVTLEYRPTGQAPKGPHLALVGKGVTFDSGGLSLKNADNMLTMKCDMAGAAAVLGAMQAIAELKLPLHVTGYMGLVENLPSGKSMKVGDVLRARNGVTIEVLNTDAEGRLVLADVLSYAVEQKPDCVVDLATLTGSCVVALGNHATGLMTNNQPWADRVLAAGKQVGELLWQLPMFDDYAEQIRGDVADIKNIGGRSAGALTAAKFLERFVAQVPWVHLDIAGPAFAEKDNTWRDGGGTGCMVATLVQLVRNLSQSSGMASPAQPG